MPGYWFDDTGGAPPSYGAGHPSNDPEPSGGGGGQGPAGGPPPPVVAPPLPNTPPPGQPATGPHIGYDTSGGDDTGGGIIDVAANQDAIDDALAIAAATNNPSTYIPPEDIYGPGQAIPGQTGYAFTNVNPNSNMFQAIQGMDSNTLAFFGYTPGSSSIPNELLNLVAQGSLVSGNEAVTSNEPYITTFSHLQDLSQQAQQGNEYAQQWLQQNTLFPEGLQSYYDITGAPNVINVNQSGDGSNYGWENWGYDDYYGDRHQEKMDLLTALAEGAPARDMEQSGFFDTLVDPYAEEQSKALEKGIFSGLMPGYTGEGMKRLLRSYGSGLQAPRYANVAKGGIVGLLGV